MAEFPVEVELLGQDGNVFAIIGVVRKALRKAGYPDASQQFTTEAMGAKSYDEVLNLVQQYVEVV